MSEIYVKNEEGNLEITETKVEVEIYSLDEIKAFIRSNRDKKNKLQEEIQRLRSQIDILDDEILRYQTRKTEIEK